MWIVIRKRLYIGFALCLVFYQSAVYADDVVKRYPEIGILSKSRINHQLIRGELSNSPEWIAIENREDLFCKWINENIAMDTLKKLAVFEEKDLTPMTEEKRTDYDESSVYFKSCNYIKEYRSPLFTWGIDKNELLKWENTDAYIDTPHSLLLIDYIGSEKKYARALFIDKKHQFHSNKGFRKSFWDYIKILFSRENN